jgi:hypothetical protein
MSTKTTYACELHPAFVIVTGNTPSNTCSERFEVGPE